MTNAQIEVDITHPYHSHEAANAKATSVGKAKALKESEYSSRPRKKNFVRENHKNGSPSLKKESSKNIKTESKNFQGKKQFSTNSESKKRNY
jgi:hypothetical protein